MPCAQCDRASPSLRTSEWVAATEVLVDAQARMRSHGCDGLFTPEAWKARNQGPPSPP